MNNLQTELNEINEKLELLTYRKNQLDSIMGEYSDVINRAKSLIGSMQDANVEPSNLLIEIESLIYCPDLEQGQEPTPELTPIETYLNELPSETPETTPETTPEMTPEMTPEPIETPPTALTDTSDSQSETAETPEMTAKPFSFDISLYPKINSLGLPVATPEPEPELDDDNDYEYDGYDDSDDETEELETTPEPSTTETTERKFFPPKCFWDYKTSLRLFINKKRRGKGEIEAIVNDCINLKLCERYDLNQCGDDWIIALSPVTSEDNVHGIIGEFYPVHTDGEHTPEPTPTAKPSNPELLKLMALVPVVTTEKSLQPKTLENTQDNTSNGYKSPDNTINTNDAVCNQHNPDTATDTANSDAKSGKTKLNERAWRRGDTLLIGFTNKKLMNVWAKWARESWADRINITNYETLENFDHCLSILWYNRTDWERLKALDYSLKPDEQQTIKTDAFEYKQATEKTTQIFRDGVLLGIAKDCDSHWESPQFKSEQFKNFEAVAEKLWELINNF